MTTYQQRRPPPPLRQDLEHYYVQAVGSQQAPKQHWVLPHVTVDVVWSPGDGPWVVGPDTRPRALLLEPGSSFHGVRLHPGHAAGLLGVPVTDLVDGRYPLADVWGRRGARLGEQLAGCTDVDHGFGLVASALMERLQRGPGHDPLVLPALNILCASPATGLGRLSQELGLGERQLRRRFAAAVGVSPRAYHRITRVRRFLDLAERGEAAEKDLHRLALEAGYADQSHLTRECTGLLGIPPGAHLRSRRSWG